MSYNFTMTETDVTKAIPTVGLKQKEFIELVQKLLMASAEHAVFNGNGKLLLGLLGEIRKGSKKHAATFIGAVVSLTPIKYDKKEDSFFFSQDKAINIAKLQGWELKKPGNGAQFSEADRTRLTDIVKARIGAVKWTDYKPDAEKKPEKSVDEKKADVLKKLSKIKEEAEALGLDIGGTAVTESSNTPVFDEQDAFLVNLVASAKEDPSVYKRLQALAAEMAAEALKSAA